MKKIILLLLILPLFMSCGVYTMNPQPKTTHILAVNSLGDTIRLPINTIISRNNPNFYRNWRFYWGGRWYWGHNWRYQINRPYWWVNSYRTNSNYRLRTRVIRRRNINNRLNLRRNSRSGVKVRSTRNTSVKRLKTTRKKTNRSNKRS